MNTGIAKKKTFGVMLDRTAAVLADRGDAPSRTEMLQSGTGRLCLKAWLSTRLAVGVLGLVMPVILLLGNAWMATTGDTVRGSLSAHYHSSGVRDVFVATMVVTGGFLITYRVFEKSWENALTVLAGLAGIGVALFPTWRDDRPKQSLTDWQLKLTEPVSARIHLVCAVTFIVALAVVSLIFARRDVEESLTHRYRGWYLAIGWAMLATVGVGLVLKAAGVTPQYGLLVAEIICTWLFGTAWLLKGLELRADLRST